MKNEYEIRGVVTAIFINSPKYGRKEILISTEKLERANEFPNTWGITTSGKSKHLYVYGQMYGGLKGKERLYLHRFLTDAPERMVVDHIDHDTLNNTNENLRIITHAENTQNKKSASSNSKSGIRGVCWNKQEKRWRAQIKLNSKQILVGIFDDIRDAEQAVIEARLKYMPFSNESI